MRALLVALVVLVALLAAPVWGQADREPSGEVTVPLPVYTQMLEQVREQPRPALADYAIGEAKVSVRITEGADTISARVAVTVMIEIFENEWTLVPVLPTGTALSLAVVDGRSVALVQGPDGLSWSTNKAGVVTMQLGYGVDARRSENGFVLPVPVPRAAASVMTLDAPGAGLDLALVPAADLQFEEADGRTRVRASIPATRSVLVSWRRPSKRSHAVSRAHYRGELQGDALVWTANYQVEVFTGELITLALLPASVTLGDILVDGEPATVLVEENRFATTLQGRGVHQVEVQFQVPVLERDGPPEARLAIPSVPVSRFDLRLPGRKELTVSPRANVVSQREGDNTDVTVFMPMSEQVVFSWVEAIPDDIRAEVRANASLYHLVHAEAGVLLVRGIVNYEITRGEAQQLVLDLPEPARVNRIIAPGVSDWRVAPTDDPDTKRITVFLDRAVKGDYALEVSFERLLGGADAAAEPVAVPLLRAVNVQRQRGVVALLAGPELGLDPVDEQQLAGVSENQLPAAVREQLEMKVARTYKYTDPGSVLLVRTVAPERRQVRANATLYHALHAEAGVLLGQAFIAYVITHGETDLLELDIDGSAQINRISSTTAVVADWTVAQPDSEGRKQIKVFLEEPVAGGQFIEVEYERLLGAGPEAAEPLPVPLLRGVNVHRQRGMVALLNGPELDLNPQQTSGVTGVGENQLPAFVRNQLDLTVAHTYRYIGLLPELLVKAMAPERKQGIFDARVDTLVSLGEVSLRGSASVEVGIKSGTLMALQLHLPEGPNVLSVSGPSLRDYQVREADGGQLIELAFTQEMEGQFRLEVNYERIMAEAVEQVQIPALSVTGAEVEHGRIAVEALSAVEVRAGEVEQLSLLDINELPRQLVLKTTNPILLAYKYVRAEAPFKLVLDVTRHREFEVQEAAIETSDYETLFTRDGLAVTTAHLAVRNSRRQFLQLELPEGSEIWSLFVDGKAEKPARTGDGSAVLIRMINSASGFPVELVYATRVAAMTPFGAIGGRLPRPDMVVTRTHWDVFLPLDFHYREPESSLSVIGAGQRVVPARLGAVRDTAEQAATAVQPLRINVPSQGLRYSFEKLYASQSPVAAEFSITYISTELYRYAEWLSALAALLVWGGILALAGVRPRPPRGVTVGLVVSGVLFLLLTLGYLDADPTLAVAASLLFALVLAGWFGLRRWRMRRAAKNAAVAAG